MTSHDYMVSAWSPDLDHVTGTERMAHFCDGMSKWDAITVLDPDTCCPGIKVINPNWWLPFYFSMLPLFCLLDIPLYLLPFPWLSCLFFHHPGVSITTCDCFPDTLNHCFCTPFPIITLFDPGIPNNGLSIYMGWYLACTPQTLIFY